MNLSTQLLNEGIVCFLFFLEVGNYMMLFHVQPQGDAVLLQMSIWRT